MTSANSLYLPINSINLAHYFKSGIILPTKLIKNRYSDIQNQNSDFLLLSTNKWVDDSDCSIEVVLSNVDKEKIIKISKNFLLYHFALPISRIKAIYFKNLEQSKVTITNINISTAFIPDHLISIEKNKNIEPISSIEAKSYTITEEPDNKKIEEFSRKFDRILGSLALMRLAGNFPKNYSDNYFHTLSHFNEAIRRDSQKHQEELALKAEDKYLELFFNQGNKDFSNTKYCRELAAVDDNFKSIREISVKYYKTIDSDSVFISLKRGVAILSYEEQLFSYMSSYGNMHYEKLIEAFKKIPQDLFKKAVNITDWGCGQAIASIAYLDFLNMKKIKQTIGRFYLIEPSEINIKRATLHIKKLNANTNIHTINKDIDTLSNQDFRKDQNYTNIHLFSNILDIDNFSMINLLNLIENNFFGSNYFICTSPYINYTKTMRIDGFVKHFSEKINFNMIESLDSQNGEWKNNWTRVIRIFHVTL